MDTSETYINMCKKAQEIQTSWKPEDGDFFVYLDMVETIGRFSDGLFETEWWENYPILKKNCVWLPRIDQLTHMCKGGWRELMTDIMYYDSLVVDPDTSLECECIKRTMWNNYKKSWNGEDWI